MARENIHGKIVLSYEYEEQRDLYWPRLSYFLKQKFGNARIEDEESVALILLDSFDFFVDEFSLLIQEGSNYSFFLYCFWLHEQSLELWNIQLKGENVEPLTESDFAMYRRILKNILEQGCDYNLETSTMPVGKDVLLMDNRIQKLLYVGTWMYHFAEDYAYLKLIGDSHWVSFDHEGLLNIHWKHTYGKLYDVLLAKIAEEYKDAVYDKNAAAELIDVLQNTFNIDFAHAKSIIYQVQDHFNNKSPSLQSIEPFVLSENLSKLQNISIGEAERFYNGLTISRENKLSIRDLVLKPYSMNRYLFRPILVYTVDGQSRALIGRNKIDESLNVLATNAIHWNAAPEEWLKNKEFREFMTRKSHEHDRILEDEVEKVVWEFKYPYCRNVKSFKQIKKDNVNIDNAVCGEIDFVIVNKDLNKIFVADSKYNRARYEGVGYRSDHTRFTTTYEAQLARKINWIEQNLVVLQEHLQIITGETNISLIGMKVEGVFFINTPTFYMLDGNYKAITLSQLRKFFDGSYNFDKVIISINGTEIETEHPFFKNGKK